MTEQVRSRIETEHSLAQEVGTLSSSMNALSLVPRRPVDNTVYSMILAILRDGQETNRYILKALAQMSESEETLSLFQIILPQGLPKDVVRAKLRAQSLVIERLLFEQIALCMADAIQSLAEKEDLLNQGVQFAFPSKDFSIITSAYPVPVVPEEAPLSIVALQCTFQRILVLAAKNLPPAQTALREATQDLIQLQEEHPEYSTYWPTLDFLANTVFRSLENLKDITAPFQVSSRAVERYARYVYQEYKEQPFSDALFYLFNSEKKLPGPFAPSQNELASRNATEYVRKDASLSKQHIEIEKKALSSYEETHLQRSHIYDEAWLTLRKSKRFIQIFREDGSAWPKRLFSIEEFTQKLSTGKPPPTLLDKFRHERNNPSLQQLASPFNPPKSRSYKPVKTEKSKKTVPPKKTKREKKKEPSKPLIKDEEQAAASPPPILETGVAEEAKEVLYVGKGAELSWQYDWHVKRWVSPLYDVFEQSWPYSGKEYSPAVKAAIRLEHTFGRALHPVILHLGKRFDYEEERSKKTTSRYTMLGEISGTNGFSRKGVFSLAVDSDGIIYHAFFTRKKVATLIAEYKEKGFFESDDQNRTVSEEGSGQLLDDGSRITSIKKDSVSVFDPMHNVLLTVRTMKDLCW